MYSLKNIFAENGPTWLERFRQRVEDKHKRKEAEELYLIEEINTQKTK